METMLHIREMFGGATLYLCLAAIACISAYSFFYATRKSILLVIDRIRRMPTLEQVFVVVIVFCACIYGGAKPNVYYDGGIKQDSSHKNVITNDLIEVYWVKDSSSILPGDSPVYIDYREKSTTNEWVNIGQSVVSAGHWTGTVPNATNYDYQAWAYFIPPEPVHTNGVWSYSTMRDINNRNIIPLKADVEVNGETIIEPVKKKRRGVQ